MMASEGPTGEELGRSTLRESEMVRTQSFYPPYHLGRQRGIIRILPHYNVSKKHYLVNLDA